MRIDPEKLSNLIRQVNGNNTMGAGALAEAIASRIDEVVIEDNNPAVAAIAYTLKCGHSEDGLGFLRCWNEGEFDAIRKEWPDAPKEVFIGAEVQTVKV